MKGWFLPYRVLNASGIVFVALRIILHMVWMNSWVNYGVIGVVSVLITTQIFRNTFKKESKTPMKLEVKKLQVVLETFAPNNDLFGSLGNHNATCKTTYTIPFKHIVFTTHTPDTGHAIHLRDGSCIMGHITSEDDWKLFLHQWSTH